MIDSLIVCLHGFLGKGEDWEAFKKSLKEQLSQKKLEFWCPSLLTGHSQLGPDKSFEEWPQQFFKELKNFSYQKCILVGYSMGGRLALHTLLHAPEKFNAAILLSTNPLAPKGDALKIRQQQDLEWAKKFLNQDWTQLMAEWNQQEVFSGDGLPPLRLEQDFARKDLAKALKNWSITKHKITLADLSQISLPMLWVAGDRDHKFMAILNNLKAKGLPAKFLTLEDSGHRIGFTKNLELIAAIAEFC